MARANEKTLASIHDKLALKFLKMLNDPDRELTAAELAAIAKFLKDNDITATAEPGTPSLALSQKFNESDAAAGGFKVG